MKIAIGSDHGGFELKEYLKELLNEMGYTYTDFGTHSPNSVDYPDVGYEVAKSVVESEHDKGILICGTGIGMSITANKVGGIRAALCSDPYSARMAKEHNDADIITMGGRVIGNGLAGDIVRAWLESDFKGEERHKRRIEKIMRIETT